MPKLGPLFLLSLLFSSVSTLQSQTDLYWGDVIVFSMAADMGGACGLSAGSDQISFVFMEDIASGTTFEMTDNGWETIYANRWDDLEGTISITRTGGTVPRGTMITLQCINNAGNFTYKFVSPDNNWTITNVNVPGGQFDLENGGDQVYWMTGGTWNNNGGFSRRATYSGRTIFGANLSDTWAADMTFNNSNLHPEVQPCYYMVPSAGSGGQSYVKYFGSLEATDHFGWLDRMASQYFNNMPTCTHFLTNGEDFTYGPNIEFIDNMGLDCALCTGCTPWEEPLIFILPDDGLFDVAYTNGIDTFYATDMENGDYIPTLINTDEISYWIVSVERVGTGCAIYSHFEPQADITASFHDPGLYTEVEVCSTFQWPLDLIMLLEGTPEPGGTWSPPIAFNQYWYAQFGDGLFTYTFKSEPEHCPPDTASVRIRFVDFSNTEVLVECDQNGTPNDILDDRIVVTLIVYGDPAYPNYTVEVDEGVVTPLNGQIGVPSVFYMSPGSALGNGLTLTIHAFTPSDCYWDFPIDAPGYCSDPCKYDMISSVTGPEDLCIKNCPDNPETIFIDISGGTPPYTMDFSLQAPNQPVWNFTGIPAAEENEIQICIDNVPAPVFNQAASLLTIPQSLANSFITFTLTEAYDAFGCIGDEDPYEFSLNVHPLPPITTTTIKLCSEDKDHFNLTDYNPFISTFLDVSWYDGNPLQGGDKIYTPSDVDFDNVVSLWAHVTDDYCENAIHVPVQIFPTPALDTVPDQEICPGTPVVLADIPLVDQGNSTATYTYHVALPPLPANMVDSMFFIPPDTTTVYVHATAGMCFDTIPITINVQVFPTFLLEGQPCDLLTGTYSVLITNDGDSLATTHGIITNNPSGQDIVSGIPNDTAITISLYNPSGLCLTTVDIVAPNCNCPQINQPTPPQSTYAVCESEPLPLLSVTIDGGLQADWYTVPSGGTAFLTNSLTYQPTNPVNAIYYVEALDAASGCYSIRTPVTLRIDPVAQLQTLDDPVGCEGLSLDFNTLIPTVLNGVAGTGQWFILPTHQPVSGTVIPANGSNYFFHFTSTIGACESSDTIAVTVNPLPSVDIYTIVCDEGTLQYDVFFTSDATGISASAGTLTQIPGTDSFALTGIAFDVDIDFMLQNSVTGCTAAIAQAAPDCSCPPLLDASATTYCSSAGVLDLAAFVGSGVNGSWQLIATPPGSNPATLAGSNFDGQNADAGAYQLRFIRSLILDDCIDTAFFNLQLTNAPTADAGVSTIACAPDIIQLSGTVTGTGAVYSWSENGTATILNPNALNTSYTPSLNDITTGAVNFTLTATDPTGTCPTTQETITITIDDSAYYILNASTQVYCDTADIQVDLDALISFGVTNGTWFFPDTVIAPITGSVFNPSTLNAGSYTVFYTSATAVAPCEDDTTGVPIIIQNCACPSVALAIPTEGVCSESGAVDLNDFLITAEPGGWSIRVQPAGVRPAIISGTQFVTNQSDPGTYVIRYTLTNPVNGCDEFAEIHLEVIPTPVINLISVACAADLQSWEAIMESSAAAITTSIGNVTSLGNNRYRIDQLPLLTTLQFAASSGNGLCNKSLDISAPDCECKLAIANLPDAVTLCPEDAITFTPSVTDGQGTITSFWIVANDSLYQNDLQVNSPGTYSFLSLDSLGCRDQHDIAVDFYVEMTPDVSAQDVQCPGDLDGIIFLNAIIGGNAPYFISINGGTAQQITNFPYSVNNLSAGNYQVMLMDGFSCSVSFNLDILSASTESLTLVADQTILLGDTVIIDPILSFIPGSFTWSGDIGLLEPDELYNLITPVQDMSVTLTALDGKGCLYEDELNIRVLLESNIIVPTIFSPNGDGINDLIFPSADPSIVKIEFFDIYDRWGEQVYTSANFLPGQSDIGWDGRWHNKPLHPAVFVYRLAAINKRGTKFIQHGDITLMR